MSDSKIFINYFPIGGRGDVLRWIARYGNLDVELHNVAFDEFRQNQNDNAYPVCQLPTVTINGENYCQTGAAARYLAKLSNLYPADPLEALIVDEAFDFFHFSIVSGVTYGLSEEAKAAHLKAWREKEVKRINRYLLRRKPSPFITGKISFADIGIYIFFNPESPFVLSPNDLKEEAPALLEYITKLGETPEFIALKKASDEYHAQLKAQQSK